MPHSPGFSNNLNLEPNQSNSPWAWGITEQFFFFLEPVVFRIVQVSANTAVYMHLWLWGGMFII